MKIPFKINYPVFGVGLAALFAGIGIIHDGGIRMVILGNERYFVGGLITLVGLYCVFLAFRKREK